MNGNSREERLHFEERKWKAKASVMKTITIHILPTNTFHKASIFYVIVHGVKKVVIRNKNNWAAPLLSICLGATEKAIVTSDGPPCQATI